MTETKATSVLSDEKLREMLDGLEGVTLGPWQVVEDKHPWALPERKVMEQDFPDSSGNHIERRIFTQQNHPQLKAPLGVVNSSSGIGMPGERGIQFVTIDEKDAAHIARCDPDTIRYLVQAELDRRASGQVEDDGSDFDGEPCATAGCGKRPTIHYEKGGIGSYYCKSCLEKISGRTALTTRSGEVGE